ncbi:RagB/SusD family nutrient uptake outer membrane protein [Carboxylicivirga marina]|uniref:RagB/SusD family nutrient uptake outer membrane protein n=1 Tax=Carboxylicivirga marina TaxID=2800988 RepID=UPI002598E99A|nr:RagB/SusD family nutrient uptake outer membrane protein [uncultured Carboxylicivirga sp.]
MKLITKLTIISAIVFAVFSTSCEDIGVSALEKPESTDVTIDTIFSSAEYAERVLWYSYKSLRSGITRANKNQGIGFSLQSDITDLSHSFSSWTGAYKFYYSGALNSANAITNVYSRPSVIHPYVDMPDKGVITFKAIRNCYTMIEHVHKVPDMEEEEKARLRAEARTLIAYNMMELFRNYGGIPWVGKVYSPDDDFINPRMTVEATVDSIVGLLDTAIPDLPWAIPESEISNWAGRFTQAGAMALKTRLLLFAASPLFNSDQPYLNGEAADKNYTWYGDYQQNRWQRAADAAKALIDKMEAQGGYALEMPATEDVWGYREAYQKAFFSRRSSEVLISVRDGYTGPGRWEDAIYAINLNYGGGTCTNEYMRMFPMANGTPISDPSSGWDESIDPLGCEGSGAARQYSRDPRLYETMQCVDDTWAGEQIENWKNKQGAWAKHVKGPRRNLSSGSTVIRKFIPGFNSGIPVKEHHFPYMRIPEIYLSYAEAMNELDNQSEAYTYINKVRNRVGLKNIEEVGSWSRETLRDQILTERACEFGFEQVRWFDMTRHKLTAAFEEQLHNVLIQKNADGTYSYTYPAIETYSRAWWSNFDRKWFLQPFPVDEVQKGYGLIQNPGW